MALPTCETTDPKKGINIDPVLPQRRSWISQCISPGQVNVKGFSQDFWESWGAYRMLLFHGQTLEDENGEGVSPCIGEKQVQLWILERVGKDGYLNGNVKGSEKVTKAGFWKKPTLKG